MCIRDSSRPRNLKSLGEAKPCQGGDEIIALGRWVSNLAVAQTQLRLGGDDHDASGGSPKLISRSAVALSFLR